MARSIEARVRRTPPSTTAAAPRAGSPPREHSAPRRTRNRFPGVGTAAARETTLEALRRDRTTAWRARWHTPAHKRAAARGFTARNALAVASVGDIPIDTHVIGQCRDGAILYFLRPRDCRAEPSHAPHALARPKTNTRGRRGYFLASLTRVRSVRAHEAPASFREFADSFILI